MYQRNGTATNQLLFVVTSNDFVTFKISVTSNCSETVTRKMGNELKVIVSFTSNRSKVTPLLLKKVTCPPLNTNTTVIFSSQKEWPL